MDGTRKLDEPTPRVGYIWSSIAAIEINSAPDNDAEVSIHPPTSVDITKDVIPKWYDDRQRLIWRICFTGGVESISWEALKLAIDNLGRPSQCQS